MRRKGTYPASVLVSLCYIILSYQSLDMALGRSLLRILSLLYFDSPAGTGFQT